MPPGRTASCLIGRNTITKDFVIAHRILSLPAAVAGITLHGIDNAVFTFLHDTHMVGLSVLRARGAVRGIPIEEDNHARCRINAVVSPLSTVFEPLDTIHAACELRNNTIFDIAALVGAPAYKAGTPFYTALETIGPLPFAQSTMLRKITSLSSP